MQQTLSHPHEYQLVDHDKDIDDDRRYVLRVRDMPIEDKPCEKLAKYGPSALSMAELVADWNWAGAILTSVATVRCMCVRRTWRNDYMGCQ